MANEAAVARCALAEVAVKIGSIERRKVGHNAKMPRMLAHGVQNGIDTQGQACAQLGHDGNFLRSSWPVGLPLQGNSLIQGNAEHQISVFEFFDMIREKRAFGERQNAAPILLNGVIPAGRGAGTHCSLPNLGQYSKIHIKWYGLLRILILRQSSRDPRYTRRLFRRESRTSELHFEPKDQFAQRKHKMEKLAAAGHQAYPHEFRWTATPADLAIKFADAGAAELEANKVAASIAGRIVSYRLMGKAGFAHLQGGGGRLQIYVRKDVVGERGFELFHLLDLGDLIGATGHLFRTKTGELSLWVTELKLLSKALLPLPEKWHGLTDVELRYRQRYLDLIANPDSRLVFLTRARIVQELRRFFDERGYLEVETPMMHPIPGGAAARPFVTHHNTLDIDLYLRIAPELYLKRLVVGGLARVYEINRNFRNEGASTQHNPEFTMLECSQAYADYTDL